MRTGIHITQQRQIIRFLRRVLRIQFFAMLALSLVAVVITGTFAFSPRAPRAPFAVGLVQPPSAGGSTGAGIFVGNGLIVSAARVVGAHPEVFVTFGSQPIVAQVIFVDMENDIALLRSSDLAHSLAQLPMGDSDSLGGNERISLVGYPGGVYSERSARIDTNAASEIRLTAESTPGFSGGAVIRDSDQTLVGLISSTPELGGKPDQGRHRAIPINTVKRVCRARQQPID